MNSPAVVTNPNKVLYYHQQLPLGLIWVNSGLRV